MVPPIEQGVLERPYVLGGYHVHGPRLTLRERVALTDLWALLTVVWLSRFISGTVRPIEIAFGVIVFMFVSSPTARPERLTPSAFDDVQTVFTRVWLGFAAASAVSVVMGLDAQGDLLALAIGAAPALIGGRTLAYAIDRRLSRSAAKKRTLVVGSGAAAERIAETIATHDEYGLDLVGAISDGPLQEGSRLRTVTLGGSPAAAKIIDDFEIDVVIVASETGSDAEMSKVLRASLANGAQVWTVPRFYELGSPSSGDHLWGLPIVRLQPPAQSRPGWSWKRVMDVAVSAAALVLLSPVLGVISLLIYLEDGRPILLRQLRVGLDGKPFQMLKFRTMRMSDASVEATEWAADEDRITPVGRVLRNVSLDELPQLINVLKGEMSLVGPRPERPHFVELFSAQHANYAERHRLPAGLTGWSQIHGLRGDTSIEERAAFDNYYVDNWTLSQDVKILFKTLTAYKHSPGGTK
ncbi:MAG TPA: sugar transferase [Actinomycetota bacterium]|nr:sugar transferase [Actinomycetota bacterium]